MDKLTNTQKILILAGFFLLGGVIGYFWNDISQLWSSSDNGDQVLDASGKPTGRYAPRSNGSARAMACCSWGGGFIGKGCKFPITKNDKVPTCNLI